MILFPNNKQILTNVSFFTYIINLTLVSKALPVYLKTSVI